MKIGFIGLGVMGRPMAEHLIGAGHEVFLHRVKPVSEFLVEKGGKPCGSPREVAEAAEITIVIVPDTPDVETVLFGEAGLSEGLSAGKMVIDMSSISPVATKEFAARIGEMGCDYVDAPVSGGEIGARNAALTIMAGGTDSAFARASPLFDILGKTITHVGPVGDGQTTKVANQIIVGLTIQAVAEALSFARAAGADPAKVRAALSGGFADSTILKVHAERMINETFDPGFRIRLHRKDLGLATASARSLGLALPNTATVEQLMNAAIGRGDGDLDHSALIRTLAIMSGKD